MKKILYIITKSSPYGGAQKYVFDMALHIRKEFDVVVALGGEDSNDTTTSLNGKLQEEGIRTVSIHSFQRNINLKREFHSFFELIKIYKQEKPDIIHLNSSKAGGTGAFAARVYNILYAKEKKVRIIFTGHGWEHTAERPRWQKKLIYLLHVLTIALTHITIAVSKHSREEILTPLPNLLKKHFKAKIVVIHNGIEHFETLPQRVARKTLLEYTPLKGIINLWDSSTLWIGSIAELRNATKGIDVAIEAIAKLIPLFREHHVSLVYFVIGDGEDRELLERLIRKHKLESSIFLVGRIPDVKHYLSAFEIYLMPSRKEGFPYALLEAAYAKLPIVATRVGGVPEALRENVSGFLVPEGDVDRIKEVLLTLAQNPTLRVECGVEGEIFVKHNFSLEAQVEKTKDIYRL